MAGVRKKAQPNGKFVGWHIDRNGKQRFFVGTMKKAETLIIARKIEDDERQIRLDYRSAPRSSDKAKKLPFKNVVAEYLCWGRAQGGKKKGTPWAEKHATYRARYLERWQELMNFETFIDVLDCLPRVESHARKMLKDGKTSKYVGDFAIALRAFFAWAEQRGYLESNPLKGMAAFDKTTTNPRRQYVVHELRQLFAVAPYHRFLVYTVAVSTGYRASELAALKVSDFHAKMRVLRLAGQFTKNRKDAVQPLPEAVVEMLMAECVGKELSEPLLKVTSHPDRYMRADIATAKISKTVNRTKVDFHSLRHTFSTMLDEIGATTTERITLMRHTAKDITTQVYTHVSMERLRVVVEKLWGALAPALPQSNAVCMQRMAVGAEFTYGNDEKGHTFKSCCPDLYFLTSPPRCCLQPRSQ